MWELDGGYGQHGKASTGKNVSRVEHAPDWAAVECSQTVGLELMAVKRQDRLWEMRLQLYATELTERFRHHAPPLPAT